MFFKKGKGHISVWLKNQVNWGFLQKDLKNEREKENEAKSVIEELEKKNVVIENMKQQNERVLKEKNGDINRLETG